MNSPPSACTTGGAARNRRISSCSDGAGQTLAELAASPAACSPPSPAPSAPPPRQGRGQASGSGWTCSSRAAACSATFLRSPASSALSRSCHTPPATSGRALRRRGAQEGGQTRSAREGQCWSIASRSATESGGGPRHSASSRT
eukprot:702911-Rhodomonas_salina.1